MESVLAILGVEALLEDVEAGRLENAQRLLEGVTQEQERIAIRESLEQYLLGRIGNTTNTINRVASLERLVSNFFEVTKSPATKWADALVTTIKGCIQRNVTKLSVQDLTLDGALLESLGPSSVLHSLVPTGEPSEEHVDDVIQAWLFGDLSSSQAKWLEENVSKTEPWRTAYRNALNEFLHIGVVTGGPWSHGLQQGFAYLPHLGPTGMLQLYLEDTKGVWVWSVGDTIKGRLEFPIETSPTIPLEDWLVLQPSLTWEPANPSTLMSGAQRVMEQEEPNFELLLSAARVLLHKMVYDKLHEAKGVVLSNLSEIKQESTPNQHWWVSHAFQVRFNLDQAFGKLLLTDQVKAKRLYYVLQEIDDVLKGVGPAVCILSEEERNIVTEGLPIETPAWWGWTPPLSTEALFDASVYHGSDTIE